MKLLIAALLFCGSLLAQGILNLSTPAQSVRPNVPFTVKISHTAPNVTGLQWSMSIPQGVAVASSGAQGTAAGKSLACKPDATLCLVYGVNQNVIAPGEVANISITLPPVTTAPGPITFALSNVIGVDLNGSAVSASAGPPLTLTVLSKFDVNGDGKVDVVDVSLAVDQVISKTACGTADFNADTRCDLVDVMLVVLSALGK